MSSAGVASVVSPASAILQAAADARPRRRSVLEHALSDRDGMIEFHSLEPIEQ
jgi:hypothetical protein